ncbi:MAG TPA: NAD(P)/FAD-dependent oxidoreductase [Dermatophilaceae bacterium]|nr:NAD(P)/FAD-dependent oxidoreductase [Dermatophilaceae bacterium]
MEPTRTPSASSWPDQVEVAVIGAGAAGLVMGHHLRRASANFVLLEREPRVGDVWRHRYDSLRLFSLPRYSSLPGQRIGVAAPPTRTEMANYLQEYAERFHLPVRTGVRVERVVRSGPAFLIRTTSGDLVADQVVVATGAHQRPVTPALAGSLDPAIRQLHSLEYRNPGQLAPGGVLVVGAANSGTDIALEAAGAGHEVWLAGRHPGQVPLDIDAAASRRVIPVVMFAQRHVLTLRTPIGRRAEREQRGHGVLLIRNKLADLDAAGVHRVGRVAEVRGGRPVTAEGLVPDAGTVVWCTGSTPDHRFLDLPVLDDSGRPLHVRGVSREPGLYFLGLTFQFALASSTLQGMDRDARYLLRHIRRHAATAGHPNLTAAV